jgi:hypothetical protein
MIWQIFPQLRRRLSCRRGLHFGKNFCASCGKQLVEEPFFLFRIESIDGQLKQVVAALNIDHAKNQFRGADVRAELTAQRLPSHV